MAEASTMNLGGRLGRILGRPGTARGRSGHQKGGSARKPLTERGRFGFSVMAILKDEAPYMEEWLCHHMAIGVDHFFLYDNGSTDELHDILKPYADHGIVTTIYFPMRGLQRDANNHVVRFFGATTDWIAYVDIDEFLVPEHDEDIGTIMARFPEAQQVLVSRKEICYSGHRTPPQGLVTESYRMVSENVPRMASTAILAKPIIRPTGTVRVGIHYAVTLDGRTVNTAGEATREDLNNIEHPSYANLQMNHYYTKSFEEFQAKRNRATTSTHSFPLPDVPFDIPAEPDGAIDRWIPRTKALMAEMHALARSPSRFGSRLRMSGFPISDQFSSEAITVVTNEVAGHDEITRKRAFKSLPLPGVRGAMARGDDHGYEAAPGKFLDSRHLAQEMAWLEADVAWQLADDGPELIVEEASVEPGDDAWHISFLAEGGTLHLPHGGPPLRCHALLFAWRVPSAASVHVEVLEAGSWLAGPDFQMAEPGTYLGLMALEKWPRSLDGVRLLVGGTSEMAIYDLALLSFG